MVPASVATFRAKIEQPTKAHTAFLRGLVGWILVRRPPDLPDLLLRPWFPNPRCLMQLCSLCAPNHSNQGIHALLPLALLLVLRTRNNTDSNKLVIFSGIALYYGNTYIKLWVHVQCTFPRYIYDSDIDSIYTFRRYICYLWFVDISYLNTGYASPDWRYYTIYDSD